MDTQVPAASIAEAIEPPERRLKDLGEPSGERSLEISMLSDRFELVVPRDAFVRDVRALLRQERVPRGLVTLLLESGQPVADDMSLEELPEGAVLCCCVTSVAMLEGRFDELESPGCKFQKYLRSYIDVPANDQRVLKTFWAFSVLARTAERIFNGTPRGPLQEVDRLDKAFPVNQVAAATLLLLDKVWCGSRSFGEQPCDQVSSVSMDEPVTETQRKVLRNMTAEELEGLVTPYHSMEAHERLLSWALEDLEREGDKQRSKHLRVAMAELDQIICRGTGDLLKEGGSSNGRQTGEYMALLKILAGGRKIRCWA